MKRRIAVLCICLICSLCVGNPALLTVQASTEVTVDDFTYIIDDAGASLKAYNGSASDVTVPVTVPYEGMNYKIRKVEAHAFDGNKFLETLVIPREITQLGDCAFKNCINLKKVTINGDLADCNGYSHEYAPLYASHSTENVSVFYNAGSNQDALEVVFGEGVTKIPADLFATAVSMEDGSYAHVTSLVIPDSVTSVGSYAFSSCYNLSTVSWGKNLNTIGSHAFKSTAMSEVFLPEKTDTIADRAFQYCGALKSVTLPASVTSVGEAAFEGCGILEKVTIEGNSILSNIVFKDCINLNQVTINGDLADCNGYSHEYAPLYASHSTENVSVFYNAGSNQDALEVVFGEGVTKIPSDLFATAVSLQDGSYAHVTSLTIPDSIQEIGGYAFYHCFDLKQIQWGKELLSIGNSAFANTSLENVELPAKLSEIGSGAFYGNSVLKSVFIPASVKTIGNDAFAACAESLSIKCYSNSAAYAYAQENGFATEALEPAYIYGDMDGDTETNAADALIMLRIAAKLQEADETQNLAGDVDNSGDITAGDALLVLQKAAKLIPAFPVETML